ncbi:hypothetical protein EXU57_11935 [Segetibacter sp. 3557_3]|uniref:hypothetical protein n=1 Tax=Segetibacter sp. 3557_3 TaxID=2547429 RepID=UPI0010587B55|nr:hypothetical protein [Segetibacter sp. 3557_3]TDH26193.1 hypothetical protein EXU57_11935 [Segetibacter sp. 3557_3]
MEPLDLTFKYKGALIEGTVWPEEDYSGWTYEVELKDYINFRIYCDDNGDWSLLRDGNAMAPDLEPELLENLIQALTEMQQSA